MIHAGYLSLLLLLVINTCAANEPRKFADFTRNGMPNIQSNNAIVIDWSKNIVLFEKNADEPRPIASLSKLAAILVIHEECKLPPDRLHTMSKDNRDGAKGGDKSKLTTGWSFSIFDLMQAALMRSDNRALPALAEACGLTPAELGERMSLRVKKLGLTKTQFVEPNGLSPENISTAREVAELLKTVVAIPEIAAIMLQNRATITAHHDGKSRSIMIFNTDRLLWRDSVRILGGKTGFTNLARYCLAVAAERDDSRRFAMVFLGAEGRHTRFGDFSRVFRWLQKTIPPESPTESAPANSIEKDSEQNSDQEATAVPPTELEQ